MTAKDNKCLQIRFHGAACDCERLKAIAIFSKKFEQLTRFLLKLIHQYYGIKPSHPDPGRREKNDSNL